MLRLDRDSHLQNALTRLSKAVSLYIQHIAVDSDPANALLKNGLGTGGIAQRMEHAGAPCTTRSAEPKIGTFGRFFGPHGYRVARGSINSSDSISIGSTRRRGGCDSVSI